MVDPNLILKETQHWTWSLFQNQSYLGRVQLTLRRQCHGSLADLMSDEWSDLQACFKAYEALMRQRFEPDRFNYVQLGNVWPQVHVHAIPRYSAPRTWRNISFTDPRWGDLPLPEPLAPIGQAHVAELVDEMRLALLAL